MKKLLLAACAALALTGSQAFAVDSVFAIPQRVATYTATVTALTPAASATDFFTIVGSATQVVRVKRISCSGVSTADGTAVVQLLRRSTADLTGTSTTRNAMAHDSADVAATAAVKAYTANPGTLGTLVNTSGLYNYGMLRTTVAASSAIGTDMVMEFGKLNDKEITLHGVADTLALNNGGASFVAGASLSCSVTWTESAS